MMCVDANQDGFIDFEEFTERFHGPVKEIGFNVAVLLTNLSEHMPDDPRWDSRCYNNVVIGFRYIILSNNDIDLIPTKSANVIPLLLIQL